MLKFNDTLADERKNLMDFSLSDIDQECEQMRVFREIPIKKSDFLGNKSLPQIVIDNSTFFKANDYVSQLTGKKAGVYIHNSRGQIIESIEYKDCHEISVNHARKMRAAGIERGHTVALLATTTKSFIISFLACQFIGALPITVPTTINLGGRQAFVEKLSKMFIVAKPDFFLYNQDYKEFIEDVKTNVSTMKRETVISYEQIDSLKPLDVELEPFTIEEDSNIQFSSGSTGIPKGIVLSQKALMHNMQSMLKRYDLNLTKTIVVGWLPFYHDMGFIGLLLSSFCTGSSFFCFEPSIFARNPLLWLELMSRYKATITAAPGFSYDLTLRKLNIKKKSAPDKIKQNIKDLSNLKILLVGSEMVNYQVVSQFGEAMKDFGMNIKAISPAYGMAEASLGISMYPPLEVGIKLDVIKRKEFQEKNLALPVDDDNEDSCHFVACGTVLDNHHLRITDDEGRILPDRHVGNIEFGGKSLMNGYLNDSKATQETFTEDGYLRTGDLGYVSQGDIYISGRKKQMIIYNGRNIYPSDLEFAIMKIPHFRTNDIAAFSIQSDRGESVYIVAQARIDKKNMPALANEIKAIVQAQCGASCDVVFISSNQMPLTSSGKLNREKAKQLYYDNAFEVLYHS